MLIVGGACLLLFRERYARSTFFNFSPFYDSVDFLDRRGLKLKPGFCLRQSNHSLESAYLSTFPVVTKQFAEERSP
jgi:hypothetical protein